MAVIPPIKAKDSDVEKWRDEASKAGLSFSEWMRRAANDYVRLPFRKLSRLIERLEKAIERLEGKD